MNTEYYYDDHRFPNFTLRVIVVFPEISNGRSEDTAAAIKWKKNRNVWTGRVTKVSSCWGSNSKWKIRRFRWSPPSCSWCSFTSGCTSDNATSLVWRDLTVDTQQSTPRNIQPSSDGVEVVDGGGGVIRSGFTLQSSYRSTILVYPNTVLYTYRYLV